MSIQHLRDAQDSIEDQLATLHADPQTTYSVGGRTFSHDQHRASLEASWDNIQAMIVKKGGPQQTRTQVFG